MTWLEWVLPGLAFMVWGVTAAVSVRVGIAFWRGAKDDPSPRFSRFLAVATPVIVSGAFVSVAAAAAWEVFG